MRDRLEAALGKRVTLNLLIQGAATHTMFTLHHSVREQLDAIDPRLVPLNDRLAVSGYLNYWLGDFSFVLGPPCWFWRRLGRADNVFKHSRLMTEMGRDRAYASKRHAVKRAKEKRVFTIAGLHAAQGLYLLLRAMRREHAHQDALTDVAIDAVSRLWGVDRGRLQGSLTWAVELGTIPPPLSLADSLIRNGAVGFSGVKREGGELLVEAKAILWVLLGHELAKGIAELVCLHGMTGWDDDCYAEVMRRTDRISLENWYIQAGGELWRRLLRVAPRDRPLADCLMRLSKLSAEDLDRVTLAIARRAPEASDLLADLGD